MLYEQGLKSISSISNLDPKDFESWLVTLFHLNYILYLERGALFFVKMQKNNFETRLLSL
jgi:hypothetical protein